MLICLGLLQRDNLKQNIDDQNQRLDKVELYGQQKRFRIFYRDGGYHASVVFGNGGRGNRKGGMYLKINNLAAVIKSLMAGNGVRKTVRLTGVSNMTVTKAKNKILPIIKSYLKEFPKCKCGKEIGHKGACILRKDTEHKIRRQWYQENIMAERTRKRKT